METTMGKIQNAFNNVFSDGPSSNPTEPQKARIRGEVASAIEEEIDSIRSLTAAGAQWKQPVRVAWGSNVAIATALENGDVLDGVTLATGDRVLLYGQSTASQNGIYVVPASGAASRATDADSGAEVLAMAVFVRAGTTNGGKQFICTTTGTINVGTTSLSFSELSDQTALNSNLEDALTTIDAVSALLNSKPAEPVHTFVDENGLAVMDIYKDKVAIPGGSEFRDVEGFYVSDPQGFSAMAVADDGTLIMSAGGTGGTTPVADAPIAWSWAYPAGGSMTAWDDGIDMGVVSFGQSYDRFTNYNTNASAVVNGTPVKPGYLLMPNGAAALLPNGRDFDGYSDLREQTWTDSDRNISSESVFSEFGKYVLDTMQARLGVQRRMICFATGRGSSDFPYFLPGSPTFSQLMQNITNAVAASKAAGKRFVMGAVLTWQGQEDHSLGVRRWERVQRLVRWQAIIEQEIKKRTGQTERIPLIVMGPDRGWTSAQAAWRPADMEIAAAEAAAIAPGRIILAGPGYQYEGWGHPTNNGYRSAGVTYGRAFVEGVLGGGWCPMGVEGWSMISATVCRVRLRMPPGRAAVIDTTFGAGGTSLGNGRGFVARDGTQSADLTINSVAVANDGYTGRDSQALDITFASAPNANSLRILYACRTLGTDATNKRLGLIRDDDPGVTLSGITDPIRNWLPPCELS